MSTKDSLQKPMNEPHTPDGRGKEIFENLGPTIKTNLIKLRHHWDKHEPRMFSRSEGVSDEALTDFDCSKDLVSICSGLTAYGTVVFGKLRIPAVPGGTYTSGASFFKFWPYAKWPKADAMMWVLRRLHDPPNVGNDDAVFHSILTDEVRDDKGDIVDYRAFLDKDTPLEWFNE